MIGASRNLAVKPLDLYQDVTSSSLATTRLLLTGNPDV